ncbi:MAG: hypothetical protein KH366_23455 [Clostridiaceae bacterium]|nr:hypothetical protein [Clostridiaceae bacterium]
MQKPAIINYISVSNGEDRNMESLTREKQKEAAETLQERMMLPIGYKRKNA